MATPLDDFYSNEKEYADFIIHKCKQFPNLFELVKISTPRTVIEEIANGEYHNIDEKISHSLAYDVTSIMAANLW